MMSMNTYCMNWIKECQWADALQLSLNCGEDNIPSLSQTQRAVSLPCRNYGEWLNLQYHCCWLTGQLQTMTNWCLWWRGSSLTRIDIWVITWFHLEYYTWDGTNQSQLVDWSPWCKLVWALAECKVDIEWCLLIGVLRKQSLIPKVSTDRPPPKWQGWPSKWNTPCVHVILHRQQRECLLVPQLL